MRSIKSLKTDEKANLAAAFGVITLLVGLAIASLIFSSVNGAIDPKLIAAEYEENITVNSTQSLGPYSLTYKPIVEDTFSLRIGSTYYTEGTDYTVDYANGTFSIVSGSQLETDTASSTEVTVSYKYEGGQAWDTVHSAQAIGWNSLSLLLIGAIVLAAVVVLGYVGYLSRGGGGI